MLHLKKNQTNYIYIWWNINWNTKNQGLLDIGIIYKKVNFVPYQPIRPVYTVPTSAPVQIPPLFHTKKNIGRTYEIWLFRPISGYQTGTFSHTTLNFCPSLPPLYHTGDDEIPIGGEERRQWFMHWKSVWSEEKNRLD